MKDKGGSVWEIGWIYMNFQKKELILTQILEGEQANLQISSHHSAIYSSWHSFDCFFTIITSLSSLCWCWVNPCVMRLCSMSHESVSKQLLIFSSSLPSFPVKGLPAAAAYDKEPRVGIAVPKKEERVSALAGGSSANGLIWEWGAQVREWQPQETTRGSIEWGEKPKEPWKCCHIAFREESFRHTCNLLFVYNDLRDSSIFLQNVALNAKVPKRRAVCLMVVLVFLVINIGPLR